ncbi:MAG TPA: TldD/PmbA family protein [Acidimicrobiales bacterium]|nr:TldD/PmbA family protein [Acidimicrobiales bacterium]
MVGFDEGFAALPFAALRSAALDRAASFGCRHADLRIERIRTQSVVLRDARLEGAVDDVTVGMGIRVVRDGAFGFAGTVEIGVDAAASLATRAAEAAAVTARAGGEAVELADEPDHGTVEWTAPYRVDPTEVPLADKIARLGAWSADLLGAREVDHVTASLLCVAEDKYFANLVGTVATQRRVRLQPSLEALAVADDSSSFETMRTVAPPVGRGYEYLDEKGWDFAGEVAEIPELLAEKLRAPSVEPGPYDLVIDPTNLWLTIHESVGHATELDRALGYEAGYAGTSFATIDKLGHLRYGSDLMDVTGDRTAPYGLASIGYDDEGVAAQQFDLVSGGVLVGYQLDRRAAALAGIGRSNGCAYADSPLNIAVQRMANVSLRPAAGRGPTTDELIESVARGIYIVGDKSWSIDMQRYNFQFTGQRFFLIDHGRLAGQLRDVAYQATTTDFWGSLAGLGGESTYLLGGAFNCGKGQPGQIAPVSHGAPSALFTQIRVLNTRAEAGR